MYDTQQVSCAQRFPFRKTVGKLSRFEICIAIFSPGAYCVQTGTRTNRSARKLVDISECDGARFFKLPDGRGEYKRNADTIYDNFFIQNRAEKRESDARFARLT